MKIIVCYKIVPGDQGIEVNHDRSLKLSETEVELSPFDVNAIEAGAQLSTAVGGAEVIGLTANGNCVENTKMRKAALSRCLNAAYAVKGDALGQAEPSVTSAVLSAAVEKIGEYDLILCGEGSGDLYNQQVGGLLGIKLGIPAVNAVSKLWMEDGSIMVERTLENGAEVLKIQGPAVISVTSDINIPRIPSMKDILGAGKKPFTLWELSELMSEPTAKAERLSIAAPEHTERANILVDYAADGGLTAVFGDIAKLL